MKVFSAIVSVVICASNMAHADVTNGAAAHEDITEVNAVADFILWNQRIGEPAEVTAVADFILWDQRIGEPTEVAAVADFILWNQRIGEPSSTIQASVSE